LREASGQGRLIAGRYRLRQQLSQRGAIIRWLAEDILAEPVRQVLVVEDRTVGRVSQAEAEHILAEAWSEPDDGQATGVDLDAPGSPSAWPSLAWEERLLRKLDQHPGLPRLRERVVHDGQTFLVEEVPFGRVLWDAWDEARDDPEQRYSWLIQVAETLVALHQAGAIVDGLRPDIVQIADDGRAVLADLGDLLPLPLPAEARVQATPYTPPELIFAPEAVDARCDLYSFGALLYALFLGRELTEMDFERQGVPKPFVLQFPDAHPALARVLMKTLVREVHLRFPTEDASCHDPSGFAELIQNLRALGRCEGQGRLDVAGWTTTGMLRSNNEDAFAIYHLAHSRQEAIGEKLLIFLADGMGGYEAGEVAAAMTLDILLQRLLGELVREGPSDAEAPDSHQPDPADLQQRFLDALRQANQEIYTLSRTPGSGKRGMGCTAEVLHLDGRCVIGAHVGDSRVYHYSQGKLRLLTRDQTLVNRLVELGQLTPEEAEQHPRKNELQQAVGGQPFLDPQTYTAPLRPGDWLVVCSDGLTSHVSDDLLVELLQRADSAEMCCRRLVNLANLQGGSDNCTVVVVRVT
jgi:serine/threonine protein phosphatase PrpC